MWKNLTKEQLDAAYNNSKAVANSSEIIQSWQRVSNDVKRHHVYKADIPYAENDFPAFDFYLADKNAPTVAFIHGGFWQMRSKDDFAFIVPALLKKNLNVAMLGYRLAPLVTMDEIVTDIQDGIRSTVSFLKNEGFSQQKIWLVGWSAGAHLASMQMNDENIIGITAISGIYDLDPMRFCYVNDQLKLDEEMARRNSPILLPQHPNKIVDIFVGGDELSEMQGQSQSYCDYRKNFNSPGVFATAPTKNHYTILDELTQPNGIILDQLIKRIENISTT
jgi:arylformamidase